jgi:hypothetical protein
MHGWTRSDVLGVALAVLTAGWVTMIALATPVPASDLPTYLALAREGVWDVDLWTDAAGTTFVNATLGYQRLCWALFLMGGWPLLVALHGSAVGVALAGAAVLGWLRGRGPGAAAAAVVASALVLQNHAARPQTLAFALAVVGLALLLRPGTSRRRWLAWTVLLAVWANLHGSFLVGLGLAACSALRPGRRAVLAAALVGSLCTPWGLDLFVYAWENSSRPAARGLAEWGRPGLDPIGLRLWPVLAWAAWRGWRARPPLWEVAPLLGLALLACTGVRHAAWAGIIGGPLVAGWLPSRDSTPATGAWRVGLWAAVALTVAGLVRFLPWIAGPLVPERSSDAWLEGQAPVEAFDVLAGELRPTRICVPFAQGGLLRWRLGPGWTVPADVRVWVLDDDAWAVYRETREIADGCALLIDRQAEPGLVVQAKNWRELYRDDRWTVRVPWPHPDRVLRQDPEP